jgi:hypothetical protein
MSALGQHDGGYFTRTILSNPAEVNQLPPNANPTTIGALPTSSVNDVGRTYSFGGSADDEQIERGRKVHDSLVCRGSRAGKSRPDRANHWYHCKRAFSCPEQIYILDSLA